MIFVFFFKQKTAYEMRISDWSSDVCSSDLLHAPCERDYGWDVDYAFGSVAIVHARSRDWASFWADRRLRCHLPYLPPALGRRVESLADSVGTLLPAHPPPALLHGDLRSEEHTSELQSIMRNPYSAFFSKKKK